MMPRGLAVDEMRMIEEMRCVEHEGISISLCSFSIDELDEL